MKQQYIFKILLFFINRLIDAGLIEHITQLIMSFWSNEEMTGDEKKAAVKKELSEVKGDLRDVFENTSNVVISTGIDIVHGYLSSKQKDLDLKKLPDSL